jgi:hypothetical protein
MIRVILVSMIGLLLSGCPTLPIPADNRFVDDVPLAVSSALSVELQATNVPLNPHLELSLRETIDIGLSVIRRRLPAVEGVSALIIEFRGGSNEPILPRFGADESYEISWCPDYIRVSASTISGVYYALQTLGQMVFASGQLPSTSGRVSDRPKYGHRGILVDSGRRFWPLRLLKQTIDGMASAKMNVLHYHFSDNCRFAVQSETHPEIAPEDGRMLSRAEVEELIRYSSLRGVRILPEIDIPGHARGMRNAVGVTWADTDRVQFSDSPGTRRFITEILNEFADLFPDEYFHIGADETSGSPTALIEHAISVLREKGKKVIGWEEANLVSHAGDPRSLTVQLWKQHRTPNSIKEAGFKTIYSNYMHLYLDLRPSLHDLWRDISHGDPNVIGGEIAMWTDVYCPLPECYNVNKPLGIARHMYGADMDGEFAASMHRMMWPKSMMAGASFWNYDEDKPLHETTDMQFFRHYLDVHYGIKGCVDTATHRCSELAAESPRNSDDRYGVVLPNVGIPESSRIAESRSGASSFGIYATKYSSWLVGEAGLISYYTGDRQFPEGDVYAYYVDAFYSTAAFSETTALEAFLAAYRRRSGNEDSTVWFVYDVAGKNDPVLVRHFVRRFAAFNARVDKSVVGKLGLLISTEGMKPSLLEPVISQEINPIRDPNTRFGLMAYEDDQHTLKLGLRTADQVVVFVSGTCTESVVRNTNKYLTEMAHVLDQASEASSITSISLMVSHKVHDPMQAVSEAVLETARAAGRGEFFVPRTAVTVHGWENWSKL